MDRATLRRRAETLFAPDNLVAWCIVPFDSLKRGPLERVEMLRRLGIKQYAFDWRDEHLAGFPAEIAIAQEHGIRLRAVWIWIDELRVLLESGYSGPIGVLGHVDADVEDVLRQNLKGLREVTAQLVAK